MIKIDYWMRKKNVINEPIYKYVNIFCNFKQLQILHREDYLFEKYLAIGTHKAITKHTIDNINTNVKFCSKEYVFKNSHIRYLVSSNIYIFIYLNERLSEVTNIKYYNDCNMYDIGYVYAV